MKRWRDERVFLIGLFLGDFLLKIFRIWDPGQTYFDERPFYIKAASAYLTGNFEINPEHPPLSKLLMAAGMKIFGDNPLGWRFFGVLLGSLGVVATYFIAKRLTGSRKLAALASIFLSFEMGWFVSARVATPEIYLASFLLFGTLFALRLFQDGKSWNLVPMGIFFGVAIASKWSAVLLIAWVFVFLLVFWQKQKLLFKTACLFAIGLLASLVYFLSYGFYLTKHSLADLYDLQIWMYRFHTVYVPQVQKTVMEAHKDYQFYPFPAWTWFFDPSFPFYGKSFGYTATKAIMFFYNPMILWVGLVGLALLIRDQFKKLKVEVIFVIGVIVSQWLPWFLSPRYTLNYYFLTAMPFLSITTALFLEKLWKKHPSFVYVLTAGVVLTFIVYYPLVSALKVPYLYSRIILGIVEFSGQTGP